MKNEDDHMLKVNIATYTSELINQLIATVDGIFRRKRFSPKAVIFGHGFFVPR
jgi:hypothetical protein